MPPVVDTAMTAGRDEAKVSPDRVADELVRGLRRRRREILVGKVRVLPWPVRFLPGVATAVVRRG